MAKSMSDLFDVNNKNPEGKVSTGEGFKGGDHIWKCYSDDKVQPRISVDSKDKVMIKIPVEIALAADGNESKTKWRDWLFIYDVEDRGFEQFALWFKRSGLASKFVNTFGQTSMLDLRDDKIVGWINMNIEECMFRADTVTRPRKPYTDKNGVYYSNEGKVEVVFKSFKDMSAAIGDAPAQSQDGIEL